MALEERAHEYSLYAPGRVPVGRLFVGRPSHLVIPQETLSGFVIRGRGTLRC